jgi:L-rhamnose-H+ transport protein
MGVLLGVLLHFIGGFASGSFYIPYKKVKSWYWESYWLIGGLFSWLIAPIMAAYLIVPGFWKIIGMTPLPVVFFTYFMGILWGFGGLTFGMSMRYLGMSLGMAIALGYCAAFGTLIPPLYYDLSSNPTVQTTISSLIKSVSGLTILAGVFICLIGIAICGKAGVMKEKDLKSLNSAGTITEFNLKKGILVATLSGILSSCFSFGLAFGKPISILTEKTGVNPIFQNLPTLVVILLGGLTTNLIWCLILNLKNHSYTDYTNSKTPLTENYLFCAIAGITWYLQFFFYGMGSSKMGKYDFSSWTFHMAFIIIVSNAWGIYFKEWKGSGKNTLAMIRLGISIVILSTIVVGMGNYIASLSKS